MMPAIRRAPRVASEYPTVEQLRAVAVIALAAVAFTIGYLAAMNAYAPHCDEDAAYAPVHHLTDGAREDANGVTRMCIPLDDMNRGGSR